MAVNLKKGSTVDLTKSRPALKNILVGLGWDPSGHRGSGSFDLDVSAYLLGANSKVAQDSDFVFYNNLQDETGAVVHQGDNRDGVGESDSEQMTVDISKLTADIQTIAFVVTIHEGKENGQNFGHVANSYIRLVNSDTNDEIVKYELERMEDSTSCVFGQLVKNGKNWDFKAVGQGFEMDLLEICKKFGVSV